MDELDLSVVMAQVEVFLGAAFVMFVILGSWRLLVRSGRRRRRRRRAVEAHATPVHAPDAVEDEAPLPPLRTYQMPVIDVSEERVFEALEAIVDRSVMGHRVLPQVALSAFLYTGSNGMSRSQEKAAVALMASRQVDFLIVDGDWRPVVAVNIARDNLAGSDADDFEAHACTTAGVGFMLVAPSGPGKAQTEELRRHVEAQHQVAAQ